MRIRSFLLPALLLALGGCATSRPSVHAEAPASAEAPAPAEAPAAVETPAVAPAPAATASSPEKLAQTPPSSPLPEAAETYTEADADTLFARGVEALKAREAQAAVSAFSSCTRAAPSRVDCHWELGWAFSLLNRWSDALAAWSRVQELEPTHEDLEDALSQARGQVALQQKLAASGSPSARPAPPQDARVRIRAVGDVMLGTDFPEGLLPPDDGASSLASVYGLLRDADLTFVNLEGPLCDSGKTTKCRKGGACYAFRTPTSYGRYLKEAGVDVASTANNHSGDFGEQCRRETEAALDALGIAWSGPPGSIATVERNGLRIGMVAFHTSPACNHLNNTETATALVRAAKQAHDLVLVSFHGGAEGSKALNIPHGSEKFYGEDRGNLRLFTHAVIDAGADLVLGHGPHVVRAMEFYKERLIVYSMGNFATYGTFNLRGPQGLGMVVDVELDAKGRFRAGRVLPTRQEGKGIPVPDASGEVIPLLQRLTREDFPDTGALVSSDGTISPPDAPVATGSR